MSRGESPWPPLFTVLETDGEKWFPDGIPGRGGRVCYMWEAGISADDDALPVGRGFRVEGQSRLPAGSPRLFSAKTKWMAFRGGETVGNLKKNFFNGVPVSKSRWKIIAWRLAPSEVVKVLCSVVEFFWVTLKLFHSEKIWLQSQKISFRSPGNGLNDKYRHFKQK